MRIWKVFMFSSRRYAQSRYAGAIDPFPLIKWLPRIEILRLLLARFVRIFFVMPFTTEKLHKNKTLPLCFTARR